VLRAVTIPLADLRSLSLYCYAVCGRMCMSSVCLVFLCFGDLLVNCFVIIVHKQMNMVVKKDRNM
jgi:type IV secretory pathway VirB3-like protein